ncbi:hypothetical protein BGZ79_004302 [Entomortierella chlamydospora]|nr:hypothetical protein BGZ79_004302 [Entomortierella chlamydospora]
MGIHNSLRLFISRDAFTIEPAHNDPSVPTENIVIQRSTGDLCLNAPTGGVPQDEEVMILYGIIGFIRLLAGEYMIVITDRLRAGRIGGHDIFKLKSYKIIPFSHNNMSLSDAQTGEEAAYISLLHTHLQSGEFYFSYEYELTHSLQRQAELRGNTQPVWERADDRFFWNYRLQSKLIDHTRRHKDQNLSGFILPIINGFVEIKATDIHKKPFTLVLISRRSRHRAGTRYFSRGVDIDGNVSNFNETEQIVVVDPIVNGTVPIAAGNYIMLAHVQTRGSVPIFWTQINNIRYTPKLQIFDNPQTGSAFRRHFETQKKLYGHQLVINLVNKKGYESPIGAAFSKEVDSQNDPQIKYHHFDFHHECSKMRWHRVSLLLNHFHNDLVDQGYFKAEVSRGAVQRVFQKQTSVALWADNADVVSRAYSGTGALKNDFTRTGKRTKSGALRDLQNSIVRYVKNNFLDGARQDAYDLFLVYDVQEAETHPLFDK